MKTIVFTAEWCASCKKAKLSLDHLQREYDLNLEFVNVESEDSKPYLELFNIYSVPTMITVDDENNIDKYEVGIYTESEMKQFFNLK